MTRTQGFVAGALLALAFLAGCRAAGGAIVRDTTPGAPAGERGAVATLALSFPRQVQAVVTPYTPSDIATLDVVPYLETSPSVFRAVDGVKESMASGSISHRRLITFGNLKGNRTYRFMARAYSADGSLISTDDASSSVTLTLTSDDRPTLGLLPVQLRDKIFTATTSVTLFQDYEKPFDHADFQLYTVSGNQKTAVPGKSGTVASPVDNYRIDLTNLRPNTTYRLEAKAITAQSTVARTKTLDIAVTDDDALATRSLLIDFPWTAYMHLQQGQSNSSIFWKSENDATPTSAAFDASGNLYFGLADQTFHSNLDQNPHQQGVIFKQTSATGSPGYLVSAADITQHAGNSGTCCINPAYFATAYGGVYGLAIGPKGLYISFFNNVSVADLTTGALTLLAGATGSAGLVDGAAADARFNRPQQLAVSPDGTVWVPDYGNKVIRKITDDGTVTTFAGTNSATASADGTGTSAAFQYPTAITHHGGNLYVADGTCIRKVVIATAEVMTFAGKCNEYVYGLDNFADGQGTEARFQGIQALQADPDGTLLVVDTGAIRAVDNGLQHGSRFGLRKVSPTGKVRTVLGGGTGSLFVGVGEEVGTSLDTAIARNPVTGDWYTTRYVYGQVRRIVP